MCVHVCVRGACVRMSAYACVTSEGRVVMECDGVVSNSLFDLNPNPEGNGGAESRSKSRPGRDLLHDRGGVFREASPVQDGTCFMIVEGFFCPLWQVVRCVCVSMCACVCVCVCVRACV